MSNEVDLKSYLLRVQQRVSKGLHALLHTRRAILSDVNPTMTDELLDVLNRACAGGKMLRAALVDIGYQIAGGAEGDPNLLPIQASVELTHLGLLIHDDIVDRSEKRRDHETMHRVFSRLHREKGYRGSPDSYGESVAMLAGDVAICLSFDFALGSKFDTARKVSAISHFVENLIKTGLGQAMDVNLTVRSHVECSEIRRMTQYKTAFYSVVAPLQLGGLLMGASEQLMTAFEGFGRPLGQVYQLRDDLLGVFGEEKEIGKSTSSDLREGKRTLLYQYGIEMSTGDDKEHLLNSLGNPDLTTDDLIRARQTLTKCGARSRIEREMQQLLDSCKETIPALTEEEHLSELLGELCDYIVRRND